MKKVLFALLAVAALSSCSNEQTLELNPGDAIEFGNAFVENSTRAAIDGSYSGTNAVNLTKCNVYGTVTGNGNTITIYNGNEVTGELGQSVWSCTGDAQYWIPNCAYKFYAIVDATSVSPTTGMPTTITYNENLTANGT